jgi:phosphoribosyl 1,2-cyclic phosphodiesterase
MMVIHPGPTLGYRIETPEGIITYIPDHEPALGTDKFPIGPEWTSGYALAAGADILIHDSQYTDEEYRSHVGWGHSSLRHTLKLAALAGVKTVVPFHHDPGHEDAMLDNFFAEAVASSDYDFEVIPAVEGMTFDL